MYTGALESFMARRLLADQERHEFEKQLTTSTSGSSLPEIEQQRKS
jgi:hypothetical protein